MAGYDRQPHRGGRIRAGTRPVVHRAEQVDSDLESARQRIKTLAAPMNALAHATFKTPCRTTARCHDCNSPDRICNGWLILEKCFPKERIAVILINEDLGY